MKNFTLGVMTGIAILMVLFGALLVDSAGIAGWIAFTAFLIGAVWLSLFGYANKDIFDKRMES